MKTKLKKKLQAQYELETRTMRGQRTIQDFEKAIQKEIDRVNLNSFRLHAGYTGEMICQ